MQCNTTYTSITASMSVIRHLHPWMTFLYPWMTFLHPWMTFLHPWMTSTNDILTSMYDISPSMDEISASMDGIFSCHVFGKNCLHHAKIALENYSKRLHKSCKIFASRVPKGNWKKFISSMMQAIFTKNLTAENSIHGCRNLILGWRNVIHG